ncbi:MAG: PDZ domain-containing protein [Pyrinomonadaceae bacterium]
MNALMRQMLGHVSVSHLGVGGGDTAPQGGSGSGRVGLLGADYAVENGKIRFKKIYRSTSFASSNGSFSAPLDQPGVDVRTGDYILEVNGNKIETNKNFYSYFENTIGKPTRIVVSSKRERKQSAHFYSLSGGGRKPSAAGELGGRKPQKSRADVGRKIGLYFYRRLRRRTEL